MKYVRVSTEEGLDKALDCIGEDPCALDFETTAFYPSAGRVRLVSLCNNDCRYLVDFDGIEGGFPAVAHWFEEAPWIVFNAGFEQRWFFAADAFVTCWDVGNLRRAVLGGGRFSLAQCLLWDLEREVSKEEQASDWSAKELTQEQLDYAFDDARHTWDLWLYWKERAPTQMRCFNMLNDMVPAVIEMEETGLILDIDRHKKIVEKWEEMRDARSLAIRRLVTEDEVANINSNPQWSDYMAKLLPDDWISVWPKTEKAGQLEMSTETLNNFAAACSGTELSEALTALSEYKTLSKYISSFGDNLITMAKMDPEHRIHASYHIGAAKTLRFSSSGPNLQQVPRDRDFFGEELSVRSSFIAPPGKLLVSLDYSGIELRVLALLSGDEQLLEDMLTGDVHLEMGSFMAGRPLDKKIVEDARIRQAAKGVSFGVIYGISGMGLAGYLKTNVGRAEELLDYWAKRYPEAFEYRYTVMEEAETTGYITCVDGGTIYMGKRPELPKAANYPVQRGALSIMARAIAYHHEGLEEAASATRGAISMASTIHDALIDEANEAYATQALGMMEEAMIQGYLDIFPGAPTERLVEGGIGKSWGTVK